MSLEPIDPDRALELYLADRENDVAQVTLYSHRSRLGHFTRWCDGQQISNLNELTGRQLHEYRVWRRMEGDLSPATEKISRRSLFNRRGLIPLRGSLTKGMPQLSCSG